MTHHETQPTHTCNKCAYRFDQKNAEPVCSHKATINPIDGTPDGIECKKARSEAGDCGASGNYWQPLSAPINCVSNLPQSTANMLHESVCTAICDSSTHELGNQIGVALSKPDTEQIIDLSLGCSHEIGSTLTSLPKDSVVN